MDAAEAASRTCAGCPADISAMGPRAKWCSNTCRCRTWRTANPEKMSTSVLAWKRANPEVNRRVAREAYARKPETAKRASRSYRARKAGAESLVITDRDWTRLVDRYRGRCALCGTEGRMTRDHIIPLARGGRDSIGNLMPTCGPCNSGRRDRLLIEWKSRGNRH